MQSFESGVRTRVVAGSKSIERVGELARSLGCTRAALVGDPAIAAAGYLDRARESMVAAGLAVSLFEDVRPNPSTDDVERCRAFLQGEQPDLLIAVGGGSAIDLAKGANFVHTNGGRMEDYWGVGKAHSPMLPLIAVPTTAGTGSEVQSYALIEQPESHQKMACGDPKVAPAFAVLDPELVTTLPLDVTGMTGLDAITHAVETAVTRKRNPMSAVFSRESFRLGQSALSRSLADPTDVEARADMLLAASFAGLAIENSMLGAAHSMANPLTAHYRVPHGQAVGMMLPSVVRFNAEDPDARAEYARLAKLAQLCSSETSETDAVEALVARLHELLAETGMPASLAECGVAEDRIETLAQEAARQWTAQFNPREVAPEQLADLYRRSLQTVP